MMFEKWLKRRAAPRPELEEQLTHAEDAHRAAEAAFQTAQEHFDELGDAASETKLAKAREAEQSAREHVARARRLLDASRKHEDEEKRQRLLARKAELEQQLTRAALKPQRDSLLLDEVEALLQAATARERRWAFEQTVDEKLGRELRQVCKELGEPEPGAFQLGETIRDCTVVDALHWARHRIPAPARRYLEMLVRGFAPHISPQHLPADLVDQLERRMKQDATVPAEQPIGPVPGSVLQRARRDALAIATLRQGRGGEA